MQRSGIAWSRGVPAAFGLWLLLWLTLAVVFAADYRGLIAWAGEWQFARFGRFYPVLTITLAVFLTILPPLALRLFVRRRRRARQPDADGATRDPLRLATRSARRASRFFGWLSIALAAASLWAVVASSRAPTGEGPIRRIEVDGSAMPAEGHARFAPATRIGRIAQVTEDVAFARRTLWVAPVFAADADAGAERAAFWTELVPTGVPGRFRRIDAGVYVHGGLPPEVAPLYRAIGLAVPREAGLLMRDSDRPRWRMTAVAVQAGAISLLALAIALILARQAGRLRRRVAHGDPAPAFAA